MTNPDPTQIAERFRRSLQTYERNAQVQADVDSHLMELVSRYESIRLQRVLEIGCCTGMLTAALCDQHHVDTLFLNDLVPELCESAAQRVKGKVGEISLHQGNIEQIALPQKLDLIISTSTFQWLANLPVCFRRFADALVEDGFLVCSLFGPGTMAELKNLTGVGLKYYTEEQLAEALHPCFNLVRMERTIQKLYFPSARDVLRHIQQTGVSGVVKKHRWTPTTLRAFEKDYVDRYAEDQGLPVSYVSISIIARKKQ